MINSRDKFQVLGQLVLMDLMISSFWTVGCSKCNLVLMYVMSRHLLLYFSDLLAITVEVGQNNGYVRRWIFCTFDKYIDDYIYIYTSTL